MRLNAKEQEGGITRRKAPLKRYLIYLLIVTFIISGVTFSKYVTSSSGGDSARVAAFGNLKLYETDADKNPVKEQIYYIAPGVNLKKNPTVEYATERGSEMATYVFTTVTTTNWKFDDESQSYWIEMDGKEDKSLTWSVDKGWKYLPTEKKDGEITAVFYRLVDAGEKLDRVPIIQKSEIKVSEKIFEKDMDNIEKATGDIHFQVYAVQAGGFESAEEAWESVSAK